MKLSLIEMSLTSGRRYQQGWPLRVTLPSMRSSATRKNACRNSMHQPRAQARTRSWFRDIGERDIEAVERWERSKSFDFIHVEHWTTGQKHLSSYFLIPCQWKLSPGLPLRFASRKHMRDPDSSFLPQPCKRSYHWSTWLLRQAFHR